MFMFMSDGLFVWMVLCSDMFEECLLCWEWVMDEVLIGIVFIDFS